MTGTFNTPFAFETIKVELVEDHLLLVTFDRPEAGNSTNTQMGRELLELWTGLYIDQQGVRCVVLTGSGEKIFNAGGDLKERNNMTDEQWQQQHALFENCLLYTSPSPRDRG